MQNTTELSNAKRALPEKYLQGNIPQAAIAIETIPPRPSKGFAPLSFEQQQLWFLAQPMPDSPSYNENLTIGFTGSLNVAALEQSLNEFISRHEIWRTSFPTIDGKPVQIVHPPSYRELAVVDLRSRPVPEREGEALRLATDEVVRPFDLAHGPLLRAMLVQLHNHEYRLFMTLHHIICDAVSIYHIFLPELHALYESFSHGQPSSLSSLPIQYADFAAWERESLQEDIFVRPLAYWKQQLANSPSVLDLPTDRPRPLVQSYRGSMQTFVLPGHLTDARASLIPVQVSGSKRPFFFLHGDWTGGAFYCFALARALGPDQPFYVLEPYKFAGLKAIPSLESIAAAHIEALRAIQPWGPYLLGGFCNGGLLAYEMARQLWATGEQVDFLALINPVSPVQYKLMRAVSNSISRLLRSGISKQANLYLRARHAWRHVYIRLRPSRRAYDFDQLLAIDPRLKAIFPPIDALYHDYVGVFNWMVSRYETGAYPGKITFYWASEEPNIEHLWASVTAIKSSEDIENHIVPGTLMSCITENIQYLAESLSISVSRASGEVSHLRQFDETSKRKNTHFPQLKNQ